MQGTGETTPVPVFICSPFETPAAAFLRNIKGGTFAECAYYRW